MFNAYVVQTPPVPYRAVLAANARTRRSAVGIKQASSAKRMRALGFGWHPQTVGAVERGERPLAAEEIVGLSLALVTSIAALMIPDPNIDFVVLTDGKVVPAAYFNRSVLEMRNLGDVVSWTEDDEPVWFREPRPSSWAELAEEGAAILRGQDWRDVARRMQGLEAENAELKRRLDEKDLDV